MTSARHSYAPKAPASPVSGAVRPKVLGPAHAPEVQASSAAAQPDALSDCRDSFPESEPLTERKILAAQTRERLPYLEEFRPERSGVIHVVGRRFSAIGPGLAKLGVHRSETAAQNAQRECKSGGAK